MTSKFYVRATGPNRYGDGTSNWLRVRRMHPWTKSVRGLGLVLEVRIRGRKKHLFISENLKPTALEFAKGDWPNVMPVEWIRLLESFYGAE